MNGEMDHMTTTPVSVQKLNEAQGAVDSAYQAWCEASGQKRAADSAESSAKSALVEAQRRFDDLTGRFRKEHNYDDRSTSWAVGEAHGFKPHEKRP
jgi:hypothetical protein